MNVEPGQQVKLNLTVENDPGTAGAQLYFKFPSALKFGRSSKGNAYEGSFQWSPDDYGLVWTCTDGHEQKAADGAVIYSFTVTIPSDVANATYSVDLDENNPKGVSVRPQGSVTEAQDIPYEFHGVKLVVGGGGSGSSSETTPTGTVLYNFEPAGASYTSGNPNTYNVKAGDQLTVNLTVKNDPGTAGGELYLDFGQLTVGRTAKGNAYDGTFQYSTNAKSLVWTCKDGHNQKASNGAVIYSFTVTVPSGAAKGDSYLIGLNSAKKSDNSIRPQDGVREAADIPFELTGLKLVVSEGGSQQQDPADAIIYDFVPDGKTFAAGSTNVVNVQPGDQVKVNLTVKNDAGTAGAEMYFTFDSKLTLGRTAKGTAYDGTFQW
ncbi:MAG: hypothetical protein J6Z45_01240, partial [Oscillospiraceae bacterium]|nr:hypothetical protein [Oscillospiraceae bacterium]